MKKRDFLKIMNLKLALSPLLLTLFLITLISLVYGVQLPESKSISLSPLGGFASEDISSELDDDSATQYVETYSEKKLS